MLRAVLGPGLVRKLVDAGSLNAARIVADSLERSAWTDLNTAVLVRSLLDRARGHSADAEAVAAAERDAASGPALMASIVRLHARSGALDSAFATLDRLGSWMPDTGENRRRLAALRDEVWRAVASTPDDLAVVRSVLAREDWRGPDPTPQTRLALARRLLDLGLATPIEDLIATIETPSAQVLRARAALASGAPDRALVLLADARDVDARMTRASALAMRGDHTGAAAEFAALGIADSALRNAILAGQWRALADPGIAATGALERAESLGQYLGQAPGHAEYARSRMAGHPPSTGLAEPSGAPPTNGSTGAGDRTPTSGADDQDPGTNLVAAAPPTGSAAPDPARENLSPGGAIDPTAPITGAAAQEAPGNAAATTPVPPDPGALFDRLSLVRRSSTLLAESERLRDAIAPLVSQQPE